MKACTHTLSLSLSLSLSLPLPLCLGLCPHVYVGCPSLARTTPSRKIVKGFSHTQHWLARNKQTHHRH
jgi:hypothetical protein